MSIESIKARAEAAHRTVSDLCARRTTWVMHVPAEPDRDPDLVISAALRDVDRLLAVAVAAGVLSDALGDAKPYVPLLSLRDALAELEALP